MKCYIANDRLFMHCIGSMYEIPSVLCTGHRKCGRNYALCCIRKCLGNVEISCVHIMNKKCDKALGFPNPGNSRLFPVLVYWERMGK